MIYLGVDPGAKGGLAAIDENSKVLFAVPMSRENLVNYIKKLHYDIIETNDGVIACVEKVGAMPGQGVTSMFSFGKSAGFIEGVLESFQIPYQLVPPQTWKKSFSLLHKDKKASIETCKQLFPGVNLLPTERCRKESDGLAESILMALFAKRKLK